VQPSQAPLAARAQEAEGDLDALERCAGAVAWGDLGAEEPGALSDVGLRRLFRLAQLTAEYLLHVQERLVWEAGLLRARRPPPRPPPAPAPGSWAACVRSAASMLAAWRAADAHARCPTACAWARIRARRRRLHALHTAGTHVPEVRGATAHSPLPGPEPAMRAAGGAGPAGAARRGAARAHGRARGGGRAVAARGAAQRALREGARGAGLPASDLGTPRQQGASSRSGISDGGDLVAVATAPFIGGTTQTAGSRWLCWDHTLDARRKFPGPITKKATRAAETPCGA